MLVHLTISNLAIISHLEVSFRNGLNILSGETGAGKSIIINAVNLILGGRAASDFIRSGAGEARVEALFTVPTPSSLGALLEEMGFPFQGEVLIKRSISREGRNRITVNGSLASLHALSRIGQVLISISGQHEHQVLLKPENHLFLLDDFGGLTPSRIELSDLFHRHQAVKERCRRLGREIREGEERQELTAFQVQEIEGAGLQPGEDLFLEETRRRLRHSEQIRETLHAAYHDLYEKEGAVLAELTLCMKRMERGAELDPEIASVREHLGSIKAELEEASLRLRELEKRAVADPHRLEEVEGRLQELNRLKRKYGPSLEDILRHRDRLSETMEDLEQNKEALRKALEEGRDMEAEMVARAKALSEQRKKTARDLERSVMEELALLAMGGTGFEVRFLSGEDETSDADVAFLQALRPEGVDRVEFMLTTNVGEDPKPLSKIASGGELSRIMLALKTIMARAGAVESIVFDEVDSGIGGAVAEVVGEKLRSLASYHQILCITHLPQIACKGDTHFLVRKDVTNRRTQTTISELTPEERVKEIARLLGGKSVSESAITHARELLLGPVNSSRGSLGRADTSPRSAALQKRNAP